MAVTAQQVKALREKTQAGMMDCKRALEEANGDFDKANLILRKKGLAKADKKADRAVGEGCIHSYVHAGSKIGVLLQSI